MIFEVEDDYLDEAWVGEDWRSGTDDADAGLRLVLSDVYADASDAEMEEALADVMDAMSPAEAINFGAALNQIARGAGQAFSDPTVASIARTALPIAGGALGTVIGGPVGTALGSQFGTIAANALPPARPPAPRPGQAPVPVPVPGATGSSTAGGSAAAAQGLVLASHPLLRQALAATAFGQHGQQQVGGIPVAQLLGMLSQVVGQAAADADELLYVSGGPGTAETWGGEAEGGEWSPDARSLYTTLIDADNLDLAEAMDLAESAR